VSSERLASNQSCSSIENRCKRRKNAFRKTDDGGITNSPLLVVLLLLPLFAIIIIIIIVVVVAVFGRLNYTHANRLPARDIYVNVYFYGNPVMRDEGSLGLSDNLNYVLLSYGNRLLYL